MFSLLLVFLLIGVKMPATLFSGLLISIVREKLINYKSPFVFIQTFLRLIKVAQLNLQQSNVTLFAKDKFKQNQKKKWDKFLTSINLSQILNIHHL